MQRCALKALDVVVLHLRTSHDTLSALPRTQTLLSLTQALQGRTFDSLHQCTSATGLHSSIRSSFNSISHLPDERCDDAGSRRRESAERSLAQLEKCILEAPASCVIHQVHSLRQHIRHLHVADMPKYAHHIFKAVSELDQRTATRTSDLWPWLAELFTVEGLHKPAVATYLVGLLNFWLCKASSDGRCVGIKRRGSNLDSDIRGFSCLLAVTPAYRDVFTAAQAARVLYIMAKLGHADHEVSNAICAALQSTKAHEVLDAETLALTVWSLARLDMKDEQVVMLLGQACEDRQGEMSLQSATMMTHALVKLGFGPPAWSQHTLSRVCSSNDVHWNQVEQTARSSPGRDTTGQSSPSVPLSCETPVRNLQHTQQEAARSKSIAKWRSRSVALGAWSLASAQHMKGLPALQSLVDSAVLSLDTMSLPDIITMLYAAASAPVSRDSARQLLQASVRRLITAPASTSSDSPTQMHHAWAAGTDTQRSQDTYLPSARRAAVENMQLVDTQKLVQLFWACCTLHAQTQKDHDSRVPSLPGETSHAVTSAQVDHDMVSGRLLQMLLDTAANMLGERSAQGSLRGKDACTVMEACSVGDYKHGVVHRMVTKLGKCKIVGRREQVAHDNDVDLRMALRSLDHLAKLGMEPPPEARAHLLLQLYMHKIAVCMQRNPDVLTGWDFGKFARALAPVNSARSDAHYRFLMVLHSAAVEQRDDRSHTCSKGVWGPESGLEQLASMMQYHEHLGDQPSSHLVTHALLDHARFWSRTWNPDQLACAATAVLSMTDHVPRHLHAVLVQHLTWQVAQGEVHKAELLARLVLCQPHSASPLTQSASRALQRSVSALHPCTALNLAAWCKLTAWSHEDVHHVQQHKQLLQALGMHLLDTHNTSQPSRLCIDAQG